LGRGRARERVRGGARGGAEGPPRRVLRPRGRVPRGPDPHGDRRTRSCRLRCDGGRRRGGRRGRGMKATRHLLLRASAGTGKTHQLSNRYLALLLGGADPETILATTFTRKAAHEILERILERLADGARGKPELAGLEAEIGRVPTAEECLDHLARLLRGMDRLRVGTIDAFFAQLARL